jgi:anti-sigma B factor antagonist
MGKKGKMIVKEVNDTVMEIFNITGFVDILTIE